MTNLRSIAIFTLLLLGTNIQAQEWHPILESFSVRQINNTIRVDFGIIGGAQCVGVQLERSSEAGEFYQIGEIQGVCGGSEFVEFYTLIDHNPLEYTTNFYRLELGQQGHTVVLDIDFIRLEDNYRVFPVPAADWTVIRFENPNGLDYDFDVYDLSGRIVESSSAIVSQELYLDLQGYRPGLYIFQLTHDSNNMITGKFQVSK